MFRIWRSVSTDGVERLGLGVPPPGAGWLVEDWMSDMVWLRFLAIP
jgi:hypothetical protein